MRYAGYKLFLLFLAGAFLGDVIETIFCRLTDGVWMSRSSVVWGPFSIVWGIGAALLTLLLEKYSDSSGWFLFAAGAVLGGAYEYVCSVFTEVLFGTVFWDYSGMPFNLNGRINLQFCLFWGLAVVLWFRLVYPYLSGAIEKIPIRFGKTMTYLLAVFMLFDMTVSSMALLRYNQRNRGIAAGTGWQMTMDEHFGDTRMKKIYPEASWVDRIR